MLKTGNMYIAVLCKVCYNNQDTVNLQKLDGEKERGKV